MKVADFVGGSITEGSDAASPSQQFADLTEGYLNTAHGGSWLYLNAGHSGMGSWTHLIDLQSECLDKHPDLVVLDCAVNDSTDLHYAGDEEEALIRRIRLGLPNARIVGVNFIQVSNYLGIDTTNLKADTNSRLQTLFAAYNIPCVDYAAEVQRAVAAAEHPLSWYFSDDNIHPSSNGHAVAATLLQTAIDTALAAPQWDGVTLPERSIDNGDYESTPIIRTGTQRDSVSGTWTEDGTAIQSNEVGAVATFIATCQSFGLDTNIGAPASTYEWRVDGGVWGEYTTGGYSRMQRWESGTRAEHTIDIRVKAGTVRINQFMAI